MNIKSIFEKYLFKVRNIIHYDGHVGLPESIKIVEMSEMDKDLATAFDDDKLKNYIIKRLGDPAWVLFLYEVQKKVVGYGFGHVPLKVEWNDSLPTYADSLRICSLFVCPEYRGQGIIGSINMAQIQYAKINKKKPWSVIESSNLPSMKAALKHGSAVRKNYLLKFLGRNLVSILTNPFKIYILLGNRRATR